MNRRQDYDTSYDLEKRLSQSIDKVRDNIARSKALKEQIKRLRRQRRQIEAVPDEVKQWFEETEGLDDESEA